MRRFTVASAGPVSRRCAARAQQASRHDHAGDVPGAGRRRARRAAHASASVDEFTYIFYRNPCARAAA